MTIYENNKLYSIKLSNVYLFVCACFYLFNWLSDLMVSFHMDMSCIFRMAVNYYSEFVHKKNKTHHSDNLQQSV